MSDGVLVFTYKSAMDEGGVEALLEKSRKRPNVKNRVAPEVEHRVIELAYEYPIQRTGKYAFPTS